LFDAATMQRFLGRFRTLIAGVARNPQVKVGDLEFLTDDERSLLRTLGERPDIAPSVALVHTRFEQSVAARPDAVAVETGARRLTYRELDRSVAALHTQLSAAGAGSASPIAVYMRRSAELVIALLAVTKTGAAWVALDPDDPPGRIAAVLDDSGANVVLVAHRQPHVAAL